MCLRFGQQKCYDSAGHRDDLHICRNCYIGYLSDNPGRGSLDEFINYCRPAGELNPVQHGQPAAPAQPAPEPVDAQPDQPQAISDEDSPATQVGNHLCRGTPTSDVDEQQDDHVEGT